jgi:PAS domain S-box-containing protein
MQGLPAICNDLSAVSRAEPWLDNAAASGYRSAALFPIRIGGETVGAFALYAGEPGVFDAGVTALLEEVSSDLAFALENMDKESRRQRAEEALRKQAQMIDQVHDAIVSTDLDGMVTSWNKGAERLIEYPAAEALGRHISFLFPPEERDFLEQGVIEPLRRMGTHEVEVRMLKKSGAGFHAHMALSLLRDAEGRPAGMIGYSMDVTRTKESQQALRESEERFRQMAGNIHEVFWLTDSQSLQVLYLSPAYERVWRRDCRDAYARPATIFRDWIHPDERDRAALALERIRRGEPVSEEFRILWPDGTVRWVWNQAFPIRDQSGQVYRFAGIAQDITERKNAELELEVRVSQQRAVAELGQKALEGSDLGEFLQSVVSLVAAVLDVEYCKVLELVPEAGYFRMKAGVGWRPAAAGEIRVPDDRGSQAGYTLLSNRPVIVDDLRTETRFTAPDLLRDHGVVSGVSVIIGEVQRPFGILGAHSAKQRAFTADDAHFLQAIANMLAATLDRRQAEAEVRRLNADLERRVAERTAELGVLNRELAARNQEVERADRSKSQFLASVSHELRTPLNAIIGFSDLLARGKAGTLNEKQSRFVGHVRVAARHLLQLINDVLDLSKVEAGRIDLIPEVFQAADALDEVLAIINPLAISKSIEIENRVPRDGLVRADRVRLKQILFNLLSNAVKFTPEHGRVWIEMAKDGDHVRIAVSDTGIGISPEEQEAVFEEFHQASPASDAVKEGTGLGLAITKKLVELHGGKIWLASEPGGGTRFSFTLPAKAAGQTA